MDLDNYFSNEQFVHKTILQLIKDFHQHGIDLTPFLLKEQLKLDELFTIMAEICQNIYENNSSKWLPLMYTIDISEKEYLRIMQLENWDKIAYFIIRREALKIYIRNHYSG